MSFALCRVNLTEENKYTQFARCVGWKLCDRVLLKYAFVFYENLE